LELEFHPKQGRAWKSESKVTLCCSGIQGGKTTVGALWALRQTSKGWGKGDTAIIGAPTYKILNQSTLPTFLKFASGRGTYQKSDQTFTFNNGLVAYLRTSTDPYSVEGIQNVRWIWLDEAGMTKYNFWINLEGRAARTGAPIICTTTPYGLNWPYHHLIKPFKEGERDDVEYLEWVSIENPSFPMEEYERQKKILDPRTFRRKYMGLHERMEGLVYELTEDNTIEAFSLPRGTRFFAGVDFGFAEGHEFALVVRAVAPDGFCYEIDEYKEAGLDPTRQVALCLAKMRTYNIEMFYCDPARPDLISMLNTGGVKAMGFHVGKENYKQVVPGIQKHNELIRSAQYKVFRGRCPNLMDEYETYHWPEIEEDRQVAEKPVAINDHLMDAARYCTVGTMHTRIKQEPVAIHSARRPHIDMFDPRKTSKKSVRWDSQ
jgi:phage terminase large subunit